LKTIVIIGAGHAGLTLAREIRQRDKSIKLVILSQENICAYYKPNLSKALCANKTPDQLVMKTKEVLRDELDADLLDEVWVSQINADTKTIIYTKTNLRETCSKETNSRETNSSETNSADLSLSYDELVLATGASPMRLPENIAESKALITVNNLEDYRRFRQAINGKQQIVILGAGFVGCELASDLASQGVEVCLVDRAEWPLNRAVPEVLGSAIRQEMTHQQGVKWFLGESIESVTLHSSDGNQTRFKVQLASGKRLQADVVVSAIGLRPNISLAQQAGIACGYGIKVNDFSETSQSAIYALGDCVEYQGTPLPFIAPATQAAKALAQTLTGSPCVRQSPPMAVPVKLTACPTVICIGHEQRGVWEVQGNGIDLEAHYLNQFGQMTGFALTGQCVSRKNALIAECSQSQQANSMATSSNQTGATESDSRIKLSAAS
jgi:rubredoxin-NAD+ reductase